MNNKEGWKGARYNKNGQSQAATKVFNIETKVNYLDTTRYDLITLPEVIITDQGLLLVGELKPKHQSLPHFSLRWDEKGDHLNVDMKPEEEFWRISELSDGYTYRILTTDSKNPYCGKRISVWQNDLCEGLSKAHDQDD